MNFYYVVLIHALKSACTSAMICSHCEVMSVKFEPRCEKTGLRGS